MQTLTIDIINDKAIKLIKELEILNLIRVRKEKSQKKKIVNWVSKYKGSIDKQKPEEIDNQLNDLRNSWE